MGYGGAVGKELYDLQFKGVSDLWKACNSTDGQDRDGDGQRPRCNSTVPVNDRTWFSNNLCAGAMPDSDNDDDVWKCVKSFPIFNVLSMLMAFPPIHHFVRDNYVKVRSVHHCLIGKGPEHPGIADASGLRGLIMQAFLMGVHLNSSVFDKTEFPPMTMDVETDEKSGTEWRYDSSKEAMNWLLPPERRIGGTGAFSVAPDGSPLADLWASRQT